MFPGHLLLELVPDEHREARLVGAALDVQPVQLPARAADELLEEPHDLLRQRRRPAERRMEQVGHVPLEQRVGEPPAHGDAHVLPAQELGEYVQVDEHGVEDVLPAGADAAQVLGLAPALPLDEGLPHRLVGGQLRHPLAHHGQHGLGHAEALAIVEHAG